MASDILSLRIAFEPVRIATFDEISSDYTPIGGPTLNAARQFFIQNLTDAILMFSFDGVSDHFPLPSEGFFLNDITTNKVQTQGFYLGGTSTLYVRQMADVPSAGAVYFTAIYGM